MDSPTRLSGAAPRPSNLEALHRDPQVQAALAVIEEAWSRHRYSYNFTWLGIPIIQLPQDIMALQEIIWATRPERIVETGVAHGGSLILSASILRLLGDTGRVIGIDVDLRPDNRAAIENHPLASAIDLIDGSSIDPRVIAQVGELVRGRRTMVVLDSNHTHEHVLAELHAYTPLVSAGCYCCVMDTIIERTPQGIYGDRPWEVGNNPMTAVDRFLERSRDFRIDAEIDRKLHISMAPRGYLLRTTEP